jgi:hypothetical protein
VLLPFYRHLDELLHAAVSNDADYLFLVHLDSLKWLTTMTTKILFIREEKLVNAYCTCIERSNLIIAWKYKQLETHLQSYDRRIKGATASTFSPTNIIEAVKSNNIERATYLLTNVTLDDLKNCHLHIHGNHLLNWLILQTKKDMCKLVLSRFPQLIFEQNTQGECALHLAIKMKNESLVEELFNYQDEVKQAFNVVDYQGHIPLDYVIEQFTHHTNPNGRLFNLFLALMSEEEILGYQKKNLLTFTIEQLKYYTCHIRKAPFKTTWVEVFKTLLQKAPKLWIKACENDQCSLLQKILSCSDESYYLLQVFFAAIPVNTMLAIIQAELCFLEIADKKDMQFLLGRLQGSLDELKQVSNYSPGNPTLALPAAQLGFFGGKPKDPLDKDVFSTEGKTLGTCTK